ncbi:MAG: hypothetical protein MOB07_24240 [Acidobacteria bacterium]|nr:hypothetical protein [Acidobacteriota bacterium]
MTIDAILFDGRKLTPVSAGSFVGIRQDDHPIKPYLAVALRYSRRFKTPDGARIWYAREMGLRIEQVVIDGSQDSGQRREAPTNLRAR